MNVILVDDDVLVCEALKTIIENSDINVVALANDGKSSIELYNKYKPDIMLMDIRMEGLTGLAAAQEILKDNENARILFLTTFADDEYIIKALQIGAKGYILKQNFESIVPALMAVYSGQSVFGDNIVNKIPSLINKKQPKDIDKYDLSPKDIDIIKLVSEGLSNKEIAAALFLSEGTVRNYISIIMDKLDIKSRTQLVIFYYNNL